MSAVYRPSDYDPARAYPLVVLLHGYAANGFVQDLFFGTSARVDAEQFLLVVPEGVSDAMGHQYWNAGPCCTFGANPPDDVAYLVGVVDDVARTHHVDRTRVYALGHSNGGAMALRLACDAPETFAAVASLAGIAPILESDCAPSSVPVSVLHMHGTADEVVAYDGVTVPTGIVLSTYPSAHEAVRRFASRLGCDTASPPTPGVAFDFDTLLAGDETSVETYVDGCAPGSAAELWSIAGGMHVPGIGDPARDRVLAWLFAHAR